MPNDRTAGFSWMVAVAVAMGLAGWALTYGASVKASASSSHIKKLSRFDSLPFHVRNSLEFNLQGSELARRDAPVGALPRTSQLILLYHDKVLITIETMNDLVGYVAITNNQQALTLARITTGDSTSDTGLREWVGWEIKENGGLRDHAEFGHIPKDIRQAVGIQPAQVTQAGGQWHIVRYIVQHRTTATDPVKWQILRLSEAVRADGHYQLVQASVVYTGPLPVALPRKRL